VGNSSDSFTNAELEQFFVNRQSYLSKVFQYLHEDVAQALRALTLAVPASSETKEIKAFGLETMQKVQEMAFVLYPMSVEELGLKSSLSSLVHNMNELVKAKSGEDKSRLSIAIKLDHEPNRVTSLIFYGLLEIMLELFLEQDLKQGLEQGQCSIDILFIEKPKDKYKVSIEVSSLNNDATNCTKQIQKVMNDMDIRLRLTALGADLEVDDNFINISFLNTTLDKTSVESGKDDL